MRKTLVLLLVCSGIACAAPRSLTNAPFDSMIGPSNSTADYIAISSPTKSNAQNCLTEVRTSVQSGAVQSNITVDLLDQGTTVYSIDASTGNPVQMFWNESDAFCIQPNHTMAITVTTIGAPAHNTNYKGYTY